MHDERSNQVNLTLCEALSKAMRWLPTRLGRLLLGARQHATLSRESCGRGTTIQVLTYCILTAERDTEDRSVVVL